MITERFRLNDGARARLLEMPYQFGFNELGATVYYRSYSRNLDEKQEAWPDTILRGVEGCLSIRKDWYVKHGLPWSEGHWQHTAGAMAESALAMRWLPSGRGLRNMGTDYVYERGSMPLYNCAATRIDKLSTDCTWLMDALMLGSGVGFYIPYDGRHLVKARTYQPAYLSIVPHVILDTREGWVESVRLLLACYEKSGQILPVFQYHEIRKFGEPIRGFGGIASGPEPLMRLHDLIRLTMDRFLRGEVDVTRMKADLCNAIGCCVVAGGVRRSAQIALGDLTDDTFLNLKNYEKHCPRCPKETDFSASCDNSNCRRSLGWMSNNSVVLRNSDEFDGLPAIAESIRQRGEPGILNLINVQKYGRLGEERPDAATLINPCGEIPLENKELCNLVEIFPTRCGTLAEFLSALSYATIYASSVNLLPTHCEETNTVIARNRRIGVSLTGIADWFARKPNSQVTRWLKEGYKLVRSTNRRLAQQAGIPESIRVTTVKPSGTLSSLVGVSPGVHFPISRYTIRRIRVNAASPVRGRLAKAGYREIKDPDADNTYVLEFPTEQAQTRPATEVSVWEQAALAALMQREWSDNSVSITAYYNPETEGEDVERVLAAFAPVVKSFSMLPHTPQGVYPLAPFEEITEKEYKRRAADVKPIDWRDFHGDSSEEWDRFCEGGKCVL